jgi:hypothetical protein
MHARGSSRISFGFSDGIHETVGPGGVKPLAKVWLPTPTGKIHSTRHEVAFCARSLFQIKSPQARCT